VDGVLPARRRENGIDAAEPSDDLISLYREIAARGVQFRGLSVLQHADEIGQIIADTGAKTLLDYGCGAGCAYMDPHFLHAQWGVDRPFLYDPAFDEHAIKPTGLEFDGVLCSDVLEHVEADRVVTLIGYLFAHSRQFVWASVCTRPAKKLFKDGRNMHVTVRRMSWWQNLFEAAAHGKRWHLTETP
jgi:hypothetical protein